MAEVTQILTASSEVKLARRRNYCPWCTTNCGGWRRSARAGKTGPNLQATALGHEAWLRLVGNGPGAPNRNGKGRRSLFARPRRRCGASWWKMPGARPDRPGGNLERVDFEVAELAQTMA